MSVKKAKKVAAKKAAVRKSVTKKPVSKKAAAKKAVLKKAAVKKAAPKKVVSAKKVRGAKVEKVKPIREKNVNKVVKAATSKTRKSAKVDVAAKSSSDVSKAIAFAKSIAAEMKRAASEADRLREENAIRLTRRPTTRQQGRDSVRFPAADLKEFRKRLLEARAKAVSGVSAIREIGFNESDDHEADGGDGTNQTLRLIALGQMGNINRTIQQIEEALHRIDDGTYGICTACGQLIRKQRLLNQPFVLTCMECQSEMERTRR